MVHGTKKNEFNARLLSIRPPCEISRTPQSTEEFKFYKAKDWLYLALYYSLPCLQNLLPKKYVDHWFLFVYGLSTFLKTTISPEESQLAKKSIEKFVVETGPLYGQKYMKFNLHIVLHIPKYVGLYGALWAWSAFIFEGFNGVISKLFHGTQWLPEQLLKQYKRLQFIKEKAEIFTRQDCNERVKSMYLKLMKQLRIHHCLEYGEHLRVFGKGIRINLSFIEKMIIEQMLGEEISDPALSYTRFIFKRMLCHTSGNKKLVKRNNSVVVTGENKIISIDKLLEIKTVGTEAQIFVVLGRAFERLPRTAVSKVGQYTSNVC